MTDTELTNVMRSMALRGLPSKSTSPSQGSYNPDTRLISVLLPQPEGPTKAMRSPALIFSEKWLRMGGRLRS